MHYNLNILPVSDDLNQDISKFTSFIGSDWICKNECTNLFRTTFVRIHFVTQQSCKSFRQCGKVYFNNEKETMMMIKMQMSKFQLNKYCDNRPTQLLVFPILFQWNGSNWVFIFTFPSIMLTHRSYDSKHETISIVYLDFFLIALIGWTLCPNLQNTCHGNQGDYIATIRLRYV